MMNPAVHGALMTTNKIIKAIVIAAITAAPAALGQTREETVFSPLTATVFMETAQEHFYRQRDVHTAMRFLEAASALDSNAPSLAETLLRIGSQDCAGGDYAEPMMGAINSYLSKQADLDIVLSVMRCLLLQFDARQDREVFLDRMIRRYASNNPTLGSELAVQMGILAAEKTDSENAAKSFNYAFSLNPYNFLAFENMRELLQQQGQTIPPDASLVVLRSMLDANPFDLTAALAYADMLRRLEIYVEAARMYEYAERVFLFGSPESPLPPRLYRPWLLSAYQSKTMYAQCLELAERIRSSAPFDLMLEAIAGRAADKAGRPEQARATLEQAAQKAEQMLGEQDLSRRVYPEYLAWFYSFVLDRPESALAWSNQAFNAAPQRQGVQAMFAYTLAVNGQTDLAKQYAEPLAAAEPVAAITMALVKRQEDRTAAIELLRKAIADAPDTFESEKAREILTDLGTEYLTPTETQTAEKAIEARYGSRIVPVYAEPRQRFSAKLTFSGGDILYGAEFNPRLIIENTGTSPLVIQDGAMLTGVIRVDATVRGDLSMDIPNVLAIRIRPSRPILPSEHIFIPLELNTGVLRKLLMTYPQASLELEFTVYLDPVVHEDGRIANALDGTAPARTVLQRRGISVTRDFLMQRLDALAKGQEGQKIQAVGLFAGLLAEQEAFGRGQEKYPCTNVETTLLIDAVRRSLADDNWRLRIHTMDAINTVVIPADYALVESLSANLNHSQWPVRFMAMYTLSRMQGEPFKPVLDWKAQNDPNPYNRRLAVALGGKEPPKPDNPN